MLVLCGRRARCFGWSELHTGSRVRTNEGDLVLKYKALPHLGTLCDPSIETPERRLRPGEGYDMKSNNGLSRKGTTG